MDNEQPSSKTNGFIALIIVLVILIISFLITAYVFEFSWNLTLPALFKLPKVTLVQSLFLLILLSIVLKPLMIGGACQHVYMMGTPEKPLPTMT